LNQLRNYFVLAVLVLSACILYILKSKTDEPNPTTRTVTLPKIEIEEDVRGNIVIIIDDFGYRDDNVSEGFLSLDADLRLRSFQVIKIAKYLRRRLIRMGMR